MMVIPEILGVLITILLCALGVAKIYDVVVKQVNLEELDITDEMKKDLQQRLDEQVEQVRKGATEFAELQAGIVLDYATEYMYKKMNNLDKYEKAPPELVADVDANFTSWLEERHPELKK